MLLARRKLSANMAANIIRPTAVTIAANIAIDGCAAYIAAHNVARPGTNSQNTSLIGHWAASGRRVATGNSCADAPIAVDVRTPSVNKWTPASAGPSPPQKLTAPLALISIASHIKT